MARLRILHMIGAANPGGAEMFGYRLLVALHKHNHVDVLAVVRDGSWLEGMLRDAGVPLKVVPFGGLLDFRTGWLVRRIVNEFKPDVVQSWMNRATRFVPKGPWATVGRLGGFYKLKYYRGRVRNLVCNTPMLVDYCVEKGWAPERVAMISNFIPRPKAGWKDVRDDMRRRLKIKDNQTVLMMAGRLHRVKGVDTALRMLADLPEKFVLLLVGEGPLRSELETMAKHLNVAGRVRWAGWQDQVTPFAAAADIWLAPSRHEPLGNTALDGWVHEVPVIASNTGGLAMLVKNGESGLLTEVDDVAGLRTAVLKLDADATLRKRVVKGGTAIFEQDYSEDGIVAKYVAYYELLSKAKRGKA